MATPPRDSVTFRDLTGFIWSVADLLRGDYKQADCGKGNPEPDPELRDTESVPLEEIEAEIRTLEMEIEGMLEEVLG